MVIAGTLSFLLVNILAAIFGLCDRFLFNSKNFGFGSASSNKITNKENSIFLLRNKANWEKMHPIVLMYTHLLVHFVLIFTLLVSSQGWNTYLYLSIASQILVEVLFLAFSFKGQGQSISKLWELSAVTFSYGVLYIALFSYLMFFYIENIGNVDKVLCSLFLVVLIGIEDKFWRNYLGTISPFKYESMTQNLKLVLKLFLVAISATALLTLDGSVLDQSISSFLTLGNIVISTMLVVLFFPLISVVHLWADKMSRKNALDLANLIAWPVIFLGLLIGGLLA
ncbi:MAG: hypothetical protein HOE90_11800 [Bacteriovoracaceae bacterium]|jgi:hypothetical protein|nr:hypothetical protein [Bacteriovoracaceae bacterium]